MKKNFLFLMKVFKQRHFKKGQDWMTWKKHENRNKRWWLTLWRLIWKSTNWIQSMLLIRCMLTSRIIGFGCRRHKRICLTLKITILHLIILLVDLENFLLISYCFIIMLHIVLSCLNINKLLNFLVSACRLNQGGLMLCLDKLLAIFYKSNMLTVKDALR